MLHLEKEMEVMLGCLIIVGLRRYRHGRNLMRHKLYWPIMAKGSWRKASYLVMSCVDVVCEAHTQVVTDVLSKCSMFVDASKVGLIMITSRCGKGKVW